MSNVVFNTDEAYVKVYESLQTGTRDLELTYDWKYVRGVSLVKNNTIKTTTQVGKGNDKHEIIGETITLSIDSFDSGDQFDMALSNTIKYVFDIEYYDELNQETLTYSCFECTPANTSMSSGDFNSVGRKFEVGSYTKS